MGHICLEIGFLKLQGITDGILANLWYPCSIENVHITVDKLIKSIIQLEMQDQASYLADVDVCVDL